MNTEISTTSRLLIITTVMLVAILEVLDSTVVNVALPYMMPSLGATQEQITWVLTSYVVASAMMIPLTGFLAQRLSHRRLLLINITGFMVSSALCGLASNLPTMVIFRLLQGGFGAALIPLSQSILRKSFSLAEQGKAMAIWGIGIMAAPVFGPTLGGIITEYSNWRWIFYFNIPICLIGILLTLFVIKPETTHKQKIDWLGIALMFIGVGCLQLFLDQGNTKDWFNSMFIITMLATSVVAMILFIIRSLTTEHPAVRLDVFRDRNFTLATIILALYCGSLFGLVALQPIMLETLFGYNAITSGMTLSPQGIGSAVGMMLAAPLIKVVRVRLLLVIGYATAAVGCYYLSTLNLQATQMNFLIANGIQGFGTGFSVVPLAAYALATINKSLITEASGLFSYGRMLGTSIGVSLLSTLVSRLAQVNWNQLGENINPFNNNLRLWLAEQHLTIDGQIAFGELKGTLYKQASMIAFNDAFFAIAIVMVLLIPLTLCMKHVDLNKG